MAEMTQQEISDFLAESHVAHIATVRPDGRPHLTPISYIAELEDKGKAYVMAPENTVKFRNVRRNPKVSLSVASDQRPFDYVLLEGEGRLTKDNMEDVLERMCLRYYPERGTAWAQQLLAAGGLIVLEVTVNKVLSRKDDD